MRLRNLSYLALLVLTVLILLTDYLLFYSEARPTNNLKEEAKVEMSQTSQEHGAVPKGSEAAKVQSEADRKIAEEHSEDPQKTLARGIEESEGTKPPEAAHGVTMSEEARSFARQHLQHRKEDIERNFAKQSHKATMDT